MPETSLLVGLWIGSVVGPNVSFMIDGLGSVGSVSWWVGLGQRKWTHGQLCVACTRLRSQRIRILKGYIFPTLKRFCSVFAEKWKIQKRHQETAEDGPGPCRGAQLTAVRGPVTGGE